MEAYFLESISLQIWKSGEHFSWLKSDIWWDEKYIIYKRHRSVRTEPEKLDKRQNGLSCRIITTQGDIMPKRKYMRAKAVVGIILSMRAEGLNLREIGDELGLSHKQM